MFLKLKNNILVSMWLCDHSVVRDEQSPHISRRAFNIINNYCISYHECTGISVFSLTTDILTSEYIFINL